MQKIEMIINARHIYTLQGEGVGYLENNSLAIDKGKIVAIEPIDEIKKEYTAEKTIDAEDKLVMPGLIDGHMHTTWCTLRGLAQDVGNWMMHGAGPFTTKSTDKSMIAGAKLGIAEAILNGTTTIGDDGNLAEEVCNVVYKYGVRGNVSVRIREALEKVYEPGALYEYSEDKGNQTLEKTLRVYDKWHNKDDRIKVLFGPQGADFVSKEMLEKVKRLSKERNTKISMHLSQGSRETKQMEMRYASRTIPWLARKNYFDEDFIGIHLTDALPDEVKAVVDNGASMVLCSGAIGIIDGIVPPAKIFQDVGGNVALGSDQANGNNCHNIFNEMKLTALFNKIKYEDPEAMPCWKVLRMATIEGARAIGLGDITGSLEVGKQADIILVDLNYPSLQPIYAKPMRNFIPNLVYSATGREVNTVIVAGKIIVENKKPLTFDLKEVFAEAQEQADIVGEAASPQFWEVNGVNAIYMKEGKL